MATPPSLTELEKKLMGEGISAGIFTVMDVAHRELSEHVPVYHQYLGKLGYASDGVIPTIVGLIGVFTGFEPLEKTLAYGVSKFVVGAYKTLIKKDPYLVVSAKSIEGFNFDADESVTLKIDGSAVSGSISTDEKGYFKYTPSEALASGYHDIVASTSKKAVSIHVKV